MKQYTTEEKIGFLQETSMTCKEIIELNKLLDKFDELYILYVLYVLYGC